MLSQKKFAKKAGINPSYLSNVENNRTKPSLEILSKIGSAFQVSIDWLLNENEGVQRGSIINSEGINIIGNPGRVSQDKHQQKGRLEAAILDRLGSLSVENFMLKERLNKLEKEEEG